MAMLAVLRERRISTRLADHRDRHESTGGRDIGRAVDSGARILTGI
jgi:hypothetical protein